MNEKYKELYDLSIKVLEEEQQRANRLDEKASRYFSVISFLIGIYGILCSRIIIDCMPHKEWVDVTLIGLGFAILIGLIIAWFLCFAVFRQHVIVKIPLNEGMTEFFNDNKLLDIYYTLARANKDALKENRKISDNKSSLLAWTYRALSVVFIFMAVMIFLFGMDIWHKKNLKGGGVTMTEENKPGEKPKEDIKPPTYDRITEGYDPSKTRKIEKGVVDKDKEKKE